MDYFTDFIGNKIYVEDTIVYSTREGNHSCLNIGVVKKIECFENDYGSQLLTVIAERKIKSGYQGPELGSKRLSAISNVHNILKY